MTNLAGAEKCTSPTIPFDLNRIERECESLGVLNGARVIQSSEFNGPLGIHPGRYKWVAQLRCDNGEIVQTTGLVISNIPFNQGYELITYRHRDTGRAAFGVGNTGLKCGGVLTVDEDGGVEMATDYGQSVDYFMTQEKDWYIAFALALQQSKQIGFLIIDPLFMDKLDEHYGRTF